MHPIIAHRSRLVFYLGVWIGFGALLAAVLAVGGETNISWALAYALPLALVLGCESLSCWYLVRALAPYSTPPLLLATTWFGAGIVLLGLWLAIALGWAEMLRLAEPGSLSAAAEATLLPLLVLTGTSGLLVAVLGHYLFAAFEQSRDAERRALELQVFAREAELKSLRAQLDPHFLFNSLNSIAALIGQDAAAARSMCFLLAGFFRKSLGIGREQTIPLAEEVDLTRTFLAIEAVRFGNRLHARFDIADDALPLAVPPLLLQPLVENAVSHGIAHLIEGGEVRIRARRREALLELAVENPCDPAHPPSRGSGVGLANVRSRVEALFGHRASVDVDAGTESFRVSILMPASPAPR